MNDERPVATPGAFRLHRRQHPQDKIQNLFILTLLYPRASLLVLRRIGPSQSRHVLEYEYAF